MSTGPTNMFPQPLREMFRNGLHDVGLKVWQDLVSDLRQHGEHLNILPKELRDEFTSTVASMGGDILPVVTTMVVNEVGSYLDNLQESLERINTLVLATATMGKSAREDVLRASVVLLHASLEDFLRTMATRLLPSAGEDALDEIPLAGLKGRPKNFSLGKLVQHRGKTVDDVLRESVCEYLERSNYNSTHEIASLLETLGFTVSEHNAFFSELEEMIQRRHQIVHRADKIKPPGSETYQLQPIQQSDVLRWAIATSMFISSAVLQVAGKIWTPEKLQEAANRFVLRRFEGRSTKPQEADSSNVDKHTS